MATASKKQLSRQHSFTSASATTPAHKKLGEQKQHYLKQHYIKIDQLQ